MSVINSIPLIAAGDDGYQISRSVRLRSSASAYFNRTPASAGNRKTWTWSGWVKRGSLGSAQVLFCSDVGTSNSTWLELGFDAGDTLTLQGYTTDSNTTAAVFRDPSAWYHVVVAFDSTQATAANRCKIYVNGTQQTLTGAGFTLNADYGINNAQAHGIGYRNWASGVGRYLDGYLTEVNFIDGQALTSSSFGETDAVTGVWKPKRYTGTYGTNGFYLNFSDNSNNTAATIGKDSSGNGNNWTPNNISVTAGVTYDSMLDTPTPYADGGNGRGNYAVLNPLASNTATLSDGNLSFVTASTTSTPNTIGTLAVNSGKWYWEVVATSNGNYGFYGIKSADITSYTSSYVAYYGNDGNVFVGPTAVSTNSSFTNNDVIGIALDADAKTVRFYKNNVAQGTSATSYSSLTSDLVTPYVIDGASSFSTTGSVNFGQRPFAYTPPTGFKALNTQNLPDSTIKAGNKYFDINLYTGTGASQSIVNAGGFQPDLVWTKSRNNITNNGLFDSVRGGSKLLISELTDAEYTGTYLSSFNSNGFTIGATASSTLNASTYTYVGWQWKKGATQGFDIVTYTGTGANRTVAHSLGVAPSMIILKQRNAVDYWVAWHSALANTEYLLLNSTNAKSTAATYWNSTSPTSSVFSLGTDSRPNGSGTTYVAYLFSEVAGFSKMGSYTGNGSATDGSFVYTGFRPKFVLIKNTTTAGGSWVMLDTSRAAYNAIQAELYANLSDAELTTTTRGDLLSNGFKLRTSSGSFNASGDTYIYAAFAENPFKNSLAR